MLFVLWQIIFYRLDKIPTKVILIHEDAGNFYLKKKSIFQFIWFIELFLYPKSCDIIDHFIYYAIQFGNIENGN